jgi:DnaJ-class molecular chaperone
MGWLGGKCRRCGGRGTVRESRVQNGRIKWVTVGCPSCSGTGRG